jgi:hypothetical protein
LMDPEVCAHFLVKSNTLRQNSIKTFTIQMLNMRDTKVWCRVNTTTKPQMRLEKKSYYPMQQAILKSLKDKEKPCYHNWQTNHLLVLTH